MSSRMKTRTRRVRTGRDTCSNCKTCAAQGLSHTSSLSRPLSSSVLGKAEWVQSSKATPLCTSAVLDSQQARGWFRGSGYLALERLLGAVTRWRGMRCFRIVWRLPWRYCLTVFTACPQRVQALLPILLFLHRPTVSFLF